MVSPTKSTERVGRDVVGPGRSIHSFYFGSFAFIDLGPFERSMTDAFIEPIRKQARGMRRCGCRKLGAWQIWPHILVDLPTSISSNLPS